MQLRPFTGTYLIDPSVIWRKLLDGPDRVHYAEDLDMWLIAKHADVKRALADTRTFQNALTLAPVYQVCPEALSIIMRIDAPPTTAAADAPVHTRTRRALRATFANTTTRVADQYGPTVTRRVDELVDRLAARHGETVDLVPTLAAELPLLVVMDILGVPEHDVPRIRGWADGQIALVWGNPEPAEQVRLAQQLLDFWHYCQNLVAERAHGVHTDGVHTDRARTDRADDPRHGTDFIRQVLRFRNGDDTVLTEAEVASLAFNLLVAGHETTAGLLAHALDYALTVPERWRRLVTDPGQVPGFVSETLRFGPAIDGWLRLTSRPVTIGGTTIPAGARCLLLIGAANRDPAAFTDPHRFDPHRTDGADQLSFGYGPHFCIGAALARLEAQTALTRLAAALPGLRLAPGHRTSYKPNAAFRAHRTLPVVVEAPGAYGEPPLMPQTRAA